MQLITLATLLPLALAAPVIQPRGAQLIPNKYIIKFKDGTTNSALKSTIDGLESVDAEHVFQASKFKGFSAKLDSKSLRALKSLPEV